MISPIPPSPATRFRLGAVLDALPALPRASGRSAAASALDLLAVPLGWTLAAAGALAVAAAKELHRACRCRDSEAVASVLGAPTAAAVCAAWTPAPRTLRQALLVGAKLLDLSATEPIRAIREDGGTRLRGRTGGLKPWFARNAPGVPYPTAMRYKLLAQRLRQALGIPAPVPLEWLLDDAPPQSLSADASLLAQIPPLRRRLAAYLAGFRSQAALKRDVDRRLGLERCPLAPRRGRAPRTPAQKAADDALAAATLARHAARLAAAVRSRRPLSRAERRALALLRALGVPPG